MCVDWSRAAWFSPDVFVVAFVGATLMLLRTSVLLLLLVLVRWEEGILGDVILKREIMECTKRSKHVADTNDS